MIYLSYRNVGSEVLSLPKQKMNGKTYLYEKTIKNLYSLVLKLFFYIILIYCNAIIFLNSFVRKSSSFRKHFFNDFHLFPKFKKVLEKLIFQL